MIKRNHFFLFYFILILTGCATRPFLPEEQIDKSELLKDECWQHTLDRYGTTAEHLTQVLNEEIFNYQELIEEALVYRADTINLVQRLEEEISQGKPLSGRALDEINRNMVDHLKLRERLYPIAEAHECWLTASPKTFEVLDIEPFSIENQLKGVMLSISAALLLYDNYLLALSKYQDNHKLRFLLNQSDQGYQLDRNELAELNRSFTSLGKRKRLEKGIKFFEEKTQAVPVALQEEENFKSLNMLIEQSAFYNANKHFSPLYTVWERLKFLSILSNVKLHHLFINGINGFSRFFGNSVGLIETRQGKLYKRADVLEKIIPYLQPGDILLEKTPFRLTDKFIPGHWGHAAIWLGTENELKTLGVWQHPVVKPYQTQISEGRAIVEALRPGVQLSPLTDFLNIDDLAVLRSVDLNYQKIADRVILALRQVGKKYDFNFDVETTDKIVCSELIYVVFTDIQWPTEKALGRFTISPDNVATKALDGGPLKLILFFHDGKQVVDKPLELMANLMGYQRVSSSAHFPLFVRFIHGKHLINKY
jgi:uncharacterized protein YycO